mgnify:CR=1 FL=1
MQVDLLSRVHSPYLLELIGYCADKGHRLLVYEYMANGSLQQHLYSDGKTLYLLFWIVSSCVCLHGYLYMAICMWMALSTDSVTMLELGLHAYGCFFPWSKSQGLEIGPFAHAFVIAHSIDSCGLVLCICIYM